MYQNNDFFKTSDIFLLYFRTYLSHLLRYCNIQTRFYPIQWTYQTEKRYFMTTKHIYFAAPLFSEMEQAYNALLVKQIRQHYPDVTVYLPQEQADINDKNAYANSKLIAKIDTEQLLASHLMIALLDGATIDVGVASEIGVAYQAGIPVLALYTDSRQQGATNPKKLEALQQIAESQFSYANLYTIGLVKLNGEIVATSNELVNAISRYI